MSLTVDIVAVGRLYASDAWEKCAERVWSREEAVVQKWKDEINKLLTFAGLFSAALTAFNVQYYVFLQPQASDPTVNAILVLMSALVANSDATDILQSTLSVLTTSRNAAKTPTYVILINMLWFSALVFSLSAASLAISVSQWLHHHIDQPASRSRQSVRIWYFRHRGFNSWNVPFIISLLPVLLQTSLALFLIGLLVLLWTLNSIVFCVVTTLVVILLTLSVSTAIIPTIAPTCPFKSQPAWWCLAIVQHIQLGISKIIKSFSHISSWHSSTQRLVTALSRTRPRATNWRDFESVIVHSQTLDLEVSRTLDILVEADSAVMDDTFLRTVAKPCLAQSPLDAALPACHQILKHHAHSMDESTDPPTLKWSPGEQDALTVVALADICIDMLERLLPSNSQYRFGSLHKAKPILRSLTYLVSAFPENQAAIATCERAADITKQLRLHWSSWTPEEERSARICELCIDATGTFLPPIHSAEISSTIHIGPFFLYVARPWLQSDGVNASLDAFYKIWENIMSDTR
ncbi:hypothetical protein IEO21_05967 [Rhodonia placenta]|uniref:DUF6535 domain-containing protein n=1 Tax=Rhodonia placenta TaxID=104341 RepID=A0A8H7U1S6_9APHY|nr:hypothetical protein IEO21_05967 [Postia placenta]